MRLACSLRAYAYSYFYITFQRQWYMPHTQMKQSACFQKSTPKRPSENLDLIKPGKIWTLMDIKASANATLCFCSRVQNVQTSLISKPSPVISLVGTQLRFIINQLLSKVNRAPPRKTSCRNLPIHFSTYTSFTSIFTIRGRKKK